MGGKTKEKRGKAEARRTVEEGRCCEALTRFPIICQRSRSILPRCPAGPGRGGEGGPCRYPPDSKSTETLFLFQRRCCRSSRFRSLEAEGAAKDSYFHVTYHVKGCKYDFKISFKILFYSAED